MKLRKVCIISHSPSLMLHSDDIRAGCTISLRAFCRRAPPPYTAQRSKPRAAFRSSEQGRGRPVGLSMGQQRFKSSAGPTRLQAARALTAQRGVSAVPATFAKMVFLAPAVCPSTSQIGSIFGETCIQSSSCMIACIGMGRIQWHTILTCSSE